jgi:hypothetical protein
MSKTNKLKLPVVSLKRCHRATGDERNRCNSKLGADHGRLSFHRVQQRRTDVRRCLLGGEMGTDTLVTRALIRCRFGIAGIIAINPLLPHLHEGAGS